MLLQYIKPLMRYTLLILFSFLSLFSFSQDLIKGDRVKASQVIENHVSANVVKENEKYKSYGFSDIIVHKPKEYKELETLLELKKTLPEMKENYQDKYDSVFNSYETRIQELKKYIIDNEIRHSFEMEHTFQIKKKDGYHLHKYAFFLNHAYKIKDAQLKLKANLTKEEEEWFYFYHMKYPLFNLSDFDKNKSASEEVYNHFEDGIAKSDDKEDNLKTTLLVLKNIKEAGFLDMDKLAKQLIFKWVKKNNTVKNLKPLKNSDLLEIKNDNEDLIGYKIFFKYQYTNDEGNTVKDVIYFELDLYFVVKNVLAVPKPWDKYFK